MPYTDNEERISVTIESKVVCPMMLNIFKATNEVRLNADADDDTARVSLAVAFLAVGQILSSTVGADARDLMNAADDMANSFVTTVRTRMETEDEASDADAG